MEQTLFINQRLKHEYADIESVGKGGYGEVFKCRHIIDGATYALKAVRFNININKNENEKILKEMTLNYLLKYKNTPDEIKNILREVIIMSKMQHKNIVRYLDSWIEKSEDQTTESDDDSDFSESIHDNTVSEQTSGSHNAIFSEGGPALKDQTTELEDSESSPYKLSELTSSSDSSIIFEDGSGLNDQMSDLEDSQYKIKLYLVLYIKMEYIPYTLKGYINEQKLYSDYKKYFGFVREIAEGLQYIHNQDVIHRDLTTVNIFITANEEIKLADFGLSRIITSKKMKMETPQKKESNRDLTMCIGTPMYAAPETETELYGPEVDLYSFGLCLFEMCYAPINTYQEKDHLFKLLRSEKFPDDFGSTHIQKRAAKLISGLLKPKPSERLSLEFIISEDFLSNDAENQEVIQEGSGMQNDKTSGGAPHVSAIAPWRPGHGLWREREKRKKENFEQSIGDASAERQFRSPTRRSSDRQERRSSTCDSLNDGRKGYSNRTKTGHLPPSRSDMALNWRDRSQTCSPTTLERGSKAEGSGDGDFRHDLSLTESTVTTDRDFIETGNIKEINLRQYQCELAKVGCEDDNNCVIIAPTNSGKTWVACKIIQENFKRNRLKNRTPKCAFIVENGTLAEQQAVCCSKLLENERTKMISGSIQREKEEYLTVYINRRDILVVTAQVLLNTLQKTGRNFLENFTIICFDECHHTTYDHPYNKIMEQYLDIKLEQTASIKLPQVTEY